jgi:lipopolysaccharide/colanic/teichoic acid biosynthesis glycosyltransferase
MLNIRRLSKRSKSQTNDPTIPPGGSVSGLLAEEAFLRVLHVEQKRTERSRRRFILMLLECQSILSIKTSGETVNNILLALLDVIRETDIKGWYKDRSVIGVIFTEVAPANEATAAQVLLEKVCNVLSAALPIEQTKRVGISFHIFPEDWHQTGSGPSDTLKLYPDLVRDARNTPHLLVKRAMDIAGSLFALTVLAPALVAIAVAIKMNSKGPVLFYQHRVGQFGCKFSCLKFRSMHTENDSAIHQAYMKRLIKNGASATHTAGLQQTIYKLTRDPRVTGLGRLLRRTSLDEVPQFFNVLKGEMSLVGPRPPIPYEVDCYELWHKQRLLAVKPGITGLWQVKGRSRIRFDDMVRLDLKYARSWSLWLDIKILLQTPRAMFSGDGAY